MRIKSSLFSQPACGDGPLVDGIVECLKIRYERVILEAGQAGAGSGMVVGSDFIE